MRTFTRFFFVFTAGSCLAAFGCSSTAANPIDVATSDAGTVPEHPGKKVSNDDGGTQAKDAGKHDGGTNGHDSGDDDDSDIDAGKPDGSKPSKDASVPPPDDAGACPLNEPLTAADLDAEIGWKTALGAPGSCTATDLTQLDANFNNTGLTSYNDLGNGLSASCKACVLTNDTSAHWGPIVATAADNGMTGFINYGACFGNVESAACGKAIQYEQFCYSIACNSCTATTAERNACVTAASTGMCNGFADTTVVSCPNATTSAPKCNSITDAIKTLCGS